MVFVITSEAVLILLSTSVLAKVVAMKSNADAGTQYPPCCGDTIGSTTCKRLKAYSFRDFERKCDEDVDFSLIQCCHSCGFKTVPQRFEKFFAMGNASTYCVDRHGQQFCSKFVQKSDIWSRGAWTCSGISAHLAFRICRRSCNYCRKDLYQSAQGRFLPAPCGFEPDSVPNDATINIS